VKHQLRGLVPRPSWKQIVVSLLIAGLGLLLWGALAVSWIDNLVRPLVISGVAKIPFLLVLFGVLGGLVAFGLIGLFLGPVLLAVGMILIRYWTQPPEQKGGATG